ncbi:PHP domain-containing protein [Dethiothermospora halolimnae]|uniref:PHP domain-containing protein n=1 Tax=Dethiothermospora halolimnae TaxID=3114390 RepID=UPI003CCC3030
MDKIDLHMHTTSSDGILSPEEVVDTAVKKGLKAIAITDHDTVEGIAKAIDRSKEYKNFLVIPGIELSCDYKNNEIHILGYFIDYNSKILSDLTKKLKDDRVKRGEKIVDKLNAMGLNISIDEVNEISSEDYIGRPHIARVLVNKNYVSSIGEAFDKYLGNNKPGYVERFKPTIPEAIDIIHATGGVAVLAHPGLIGNNITLDEILKFKFDGIEVIHSKHDDDDRHKFNLISESLNLIKTAGSDCHGYMMNNSLLMGKYFTNFEVVNKLKLAADKYRG